MSDQLRKLLLVEGCDDRHVVTHIWMHHCSKLLPFTIRETEGIENLFRFLPIELKVESTDILGVVMDANDDPVKRWEQLISRIRQVPQIQITDQPEPYGTIINS